MSTTTMKIAAILLTAVALTACGGSAPARLSLSNQVRVSGAEVVLARNCVNQLNGTPQGSQFAAIYRAVQALIGVFRASPGGIYQPGGKGQSRTMREVLSDEASSLDGCDPQDAHDLDRALAAG